MAKFDLITGDEIVIDEIGFPKSVQVQGDWVYYMNSDDRFYNNIYRVRTDGSARQQLTRSTALSMHVYNEWIYYSDMDLENFRKIRIDGTDDQKINDDLAFMIHIVDEWIYYKSMSKEHGDDTPTIRVRLDGSDREVFMKD